jgi:hypothetical protein
MRVHGTKLGAISTGRGLGDQLYDLAGQVPSLDLNFAGTKTLDPLVTFTRASSGTYTDSAGVIQTAATDVPRFDHNPTTGESLGLLVEEQRTNLLLRSEEFDNASWAKLDSTVTADAIDSPGGTLAGDFVVENATTARHSVNQTYTKAASAIQYTLTVYAKSNSSRNLVILANGASFNDRVEAGFNTTTGTVAPVNILGNFSSTSSSIINAGNGWYRCSITFTSDATTSLVTRLLLINQNPITNPSSTSYTGDGTSGVYLWGAQLEAGAFPTSYIPTTAAAATRSADVASITGSNYTSWANNNEGTVFSDSSIIASQVKTQAVWELSGGTVLSSLRQPHGTANQFRAVIGGTFTGSPGTGATLTTGVTRAAVAYSGTAGRLQVESAGANATGSALDATSLSIGSLAGSTQLNGRIKRLTYWPTRLADTTLQSLTQ